MLGCFNLRHILSSFSSFCISARVGGGRGEGGGGRRRREGDRDSFPDLSAQLPLEAGGQLHTVNSPTYYLNCSLVSHFHSKKKFYSREKF